jgi:hypothetical protein
MTASTRVAESEDQSVQRKRGVPPWLPAVVVFVVYGVFIAQYLGQGRDVRDFIWLSSRWVKHSHASQVIRYDPQYHYARGHNDYDGEYYYFIALDPLNARGYLDEPSTRYTRIVYPLLVRSLAGGQASLIPYMMVLVNWLIIPLSTWWVAIWLRRRGISVWLSLIYGLYSGTFIGLTRDLTDPLAYAFVALAVLLYDDERWRGMLLSAAAFAVACLTRETTAVFAMAYGVSLAWRDGLDRSRIRAHVPQALIYLFIAVGPLIVLSAILNLTLGTHKNGALPQAIPFGGLFAYWPWNAARVLEVITVVIPAGICSAVCIWALGKREWTPAIAVLLATVLLFVVFGSKATYFHYTASGRYSDAVMLAALYCIPVFDRVLRGRRWWLGLSAIGWLLVTPIEYSAYIFKPFV